MVSSWRAVRRRRRDGTPEGQDECFRLLFSGNPQPMWVYDLETLRFLEVNDAAVDRYGYGRDEFLGMRITDIRPEQDVPRLLENVRAGRPDLQGSGVWRHVRQDGTVIDVDIRSHVLDWHGRAAALVVADDVTERVLAESALVDSAERLRELDDLKNSILHAVSHELRTPLSVVLGLAMTLRDRLERLSGPQVREVADRLVSGAERIDHLLNGLLDLDRVTRGLVEPVRQPTDVVALARRVVEESGVSRVRVRVQDDPVVANVDPGKVERIVENLLVNAERHTPPGTEVWIGASHERDDTVLLSVEDSGPGVPDELKDRIFDAYERGDSSGTGIGLSLVAQFARIHGGRAWVEDRSGGGARFLVLLPAG